MRLSPPIPQPKAAKPANWKAADRQGSAEVKRRSGGRCEVVEVVGARLVACPNRATEVHHLIGGWKIRGRGISASALRKQHVCISHHKAITGDVGVKLKRIGGPVPYYTDCYRRAGK